MRYLKVRDDGKYILLGTDYDERHLAGRLPGSRWDPREKCWKVPATPACALAVLETFEDLLPFTGEDDRFDRLVEEARRRRAVRERQPAREPDYPFVTRPWRHQVEATRFARDIDAALLHCWMGAGKALPSDALVHTPTGPRRMDELEVGDRVLTPTGEARVIGVFPQGQQDVYRVSFTPGDSVECTADHLWQVNWWSGERVSGENTHVARSDVLPLSAIMRDYETLTTSGRRNRKYWVPLPRPLHYRRRLVPLDPYVLGVLLGDGCLSSSAVSLMNPEPQIVGQVRARLPEDFDLRETTSQDHYYLTGNPRLRQILQRLGLFGHRSHEKFVPNTYKHNALDVRLATLRGLFDTDGCVGIGGNVTFTSTSRRLAEDVKELIEGIGGLAHIRSRVTHYTHNGERRRGRRSWRLTVRLGEPGLLFTLARKKNRTRTPKKYLPKRMITGIEPAGRKPCRCIRIDSADGLFLTDHAIPTHNTKVALDAARARGHRRVLIICPKSVIPVWRDETGKHAPDEYDIILLEDGSVEDRAGRLEQAIVDPPRPVLAVVNYEATWREPLAEVILSCDWDLLVFDESQRIKSPGAKQSRFAARIRAGHRLALTGTPMPHSPLDLYGQYRALDPGIFGTSFTRFRGRYAVMGGYENKQVLGFKNEEELRSGMDRICYHVPKDALDLPPITIGERYCSLGAEAARIYRDLEEEFIAQVDDGVVTAANALSKLLRLQQVAAGFVKLEGGREREMGTAKADLLREVLEDIGREDRAVVFCRFHHDLDTVRRVAEELDRGGYERTCGEISGRVNEYSQWKRGEFSTLAVQLQAGGLGIDLSKANYAVFYTLSFSLGNYLQAIARLHRPGQEKPVVVYRLLARGTVDKKIIHALDRREDVIRSILEDVQTAASRKGQ